MRRLVVLVLLAASGCTADPAPSDASMGDDAGSRCESDEGCDDGRFCNGSERCDPASSAADDRGCAPGPAPCADSACDEAENTCTVSCGVRDADGDGAEAIACGGTDCDDHDAARRPGATEVCDADDRDEDCDPRTIGDRDADGDGAIDRACCNLDGAGLLCGTDCDDTGSGISPRASETCNAIDDDCDGLIDDVVPGAVTCTSGSSAPCVTACGVEGTQACRADCLGFAACVGAEQCNGCDDDADGARDEDFACERGFPVGCTTACGTRGTRQCTLACELEACLAPEVCNYCDDDGVNGYADERALAIDSASHTLRGGGAAFGVASEQGLPAGGSTYIVARLLDGAAVEQAGAYWFDLPAARVGWGPVRIEARLEARVLDSGYPFGGWSVVIARGGTGDLGTPQDHGVPRARTGVRFDWHWSSPDPSTSLPLANDQKGYRLMNGTGFVVRGYTRFDASAHTDIANADADLDSGDSSYVTQRVIIEYQPENPFTAVREERIRFVTNGGETIYAPDTNFETLDPNDDLPVGSTIRIGLTAGSYSYTFTPPSGPAVTLGARVEAQVALATFTPPSGPTAPTWVDHLTASRALICPEL